MSQCDAFCMGKKRASVTRRPDYFCNRPNPWVRAYAAASYCDAARKGTGGCAVRECGTGDRRRVRGSAVLDYRMGDRRRIGGSAAIRRSWHRMAPRLLTDYLKTIRRLSNKPCPHDRTQNMWRRVCLAWRASSRSAFELGRPDGMAALSKTPTAGLPKNPEP